MQFNANAISGYFSEDELKIALGVWGGGYTADLLSKMLFDHFVHNETSKGKSLLIDLLVKGIYGTALFYGGKKSPFLRYMALGSLVSMINSITNYFLPTPTSVMEKVQNVAQKAGLNIQSF